MYFARNKGVKRRRRRNRAQTGIIKGPRFRRQEMAARGPRFGRCDWKMSAKNDVIGGEESWDLLESEFDCVIEKAFMVNKQGLFKDLFMNDYKYLTFLGLLSSDQGR